MAWIALLAGVHLIAGWYTATRFFKPERLCDLPLIWLLISFSTFYGIPVIIGTITGQLNTGVIIISALLAAGAGGAGLYHNRCRTYGQQIRGWLKAQSLVTWSLVFIMTVIVMSTMFMGAALPIRTFDAYSYHVLAPMHWLQTGRFDQSVFPNADVTPYLAAGEVYPNIKAILPYLVMLWTGSDAGTGLAQWPFLSLLAAALISFYRRLGLTVSFTIIGIVLTITAPEVFLQSMESYSDVIYIAGLMATLAINLLIWQQGCSWSSIALASMAFAQWAGSKPSSLLPCVMVGLAYLIALAWGPGGRSTKPAIRARNTAVGFAAVVILAVAMSGVWYIHGLQRFGNPVYPIEAKIAGKVIFEGPFPPTMNTDFAARYTGKTGWGAWWGAMTDSWRSPLISSWGGGMGAAAFIVGLPSVILLLLFAPFYWQRRGFTFSLLMFLGIIVSSSSLTLPRFLLFTLPLGGMAIGLLAQGLQAWSRCLLSLMVLGLCAYNLVISFPSVLYRARPAELLLMGLVSGHTRSAKNDAFPDEYSAGDYWLDFVAGSEKKLAITDATAMWHVYHPASNPDILWLAVKEGQTAKQWLGEARSAGATHVFLPRSSRLYQEVRQSQGEVRALYEDTFARVNRAAFMEMPVLAGGLFEIVY